MRLIFSQDWTSLLGRDDWPVREFRIIEMSFEIDKGLYLTCAFLGIGLGISIYKRRATEITAKDVFKSFTRRFL